MNKSITPNIILDESDAFGSTNYKVVRSLLHMVDRNMMRALGKPMFSTRQCIIMPTDGVPMCSKAGELHLIFLNSKENYWCQWVYQFAHEYCHHLIDGPLSGEWSQLLWFEETICELSSLYNLNKMVGFCMMSGLQVYVPSVQNYLGNLLTKNKNTYCLDVRGGWYKRFEVSLGELEYQRDLYNAIAVMMLPLFLENPSLWKLILSIGDIRSWKSLFELFSHIEVNADESFKKSFKRMKQIFGY